MTNFEERSKEWVQGWNDHIRGLPIDACPYKDEVRSEPWYEGWTWAKEHGWFGRNLRAK